MTKKSTFEKIKNVVKTDIKPSIEKSPVIINKSRSSIQYRILLPKKFGDLLKIGKDTHYSEFKLINKGTPNNPEYVLIAEIKKND
ncbi:hypothetical protein JXB41_00085 [Candidatus Woesearchaeota archaeon]|nr:hypothetical protein [Candidatus Woesearchaeota archaeon]